VQGLHVVSAAGGTPVVVLPQEPSSTGVVPVFTTCVGPRTAEAGLDGATWPVISQSNSIRRELLLHAGRRVGLAERLYIGGRLRGPSTVNS
jgi:hypothetical protein